MAPADGSRGEPTTGRMGDDPPIRVLIVDDSLTVRTALSRMVEEAGDLSVAATAGSAETAITRLVTTPVDVILLDLEMPGMGGLEALPKLLASAAGAQVLVVSSLTEAGAEHTLAALSMGAADTMLKPRSGKFDHAYRETLIARIRALGANRVFRTRSGAEPAPLARPLRGKRPQLVAIGASTGGIHALNQFLRKLPPSFDLPILVTQHLPASFMSVFARQLEVAGARRTLIADDGTPVRRGTILVAPGHGHLIVRKSPTGLVTAISIEPASSGCMPSVDPMLASLAEACDGAALGIVLSGMGRDGAEGAAHLVRAGGTVLAQDANSSAVWGMPRAVVEAGLASAVLPPERLVGRLLETAGAASWT